MCPAGLAFDPDVQMNYEKLGSSELSVSVIGLGSQFWGSGLTKAKAFQQLDQAFDLGINLIDTAETYPVPYAESTWGDSERIIGEWLKLKKVRERVVVATKVTGRSRDFRYIRDGHQKLNRTNIVTSLEGMLKRLQTEYVDLFQLHWPERPTNFFGQLGYDHVEEADSEMTSIEETLGVLDDLICAGKIRFVGICNETPWGMMRYVALSEQLALPRIVSIQNPYNLLNRVFEIGHAEVAMRERCSLLAYSPLAHGVLCGKYTGRTIPSGSRFEKYPFFKRYKGDRALRASDVYVKLARKYAIDPSQMAIAYIINRPFVASTLLSVSNAIQLQNNAESIDVSLPQQLINELEDYHETNSNPAP